MSDSSSKLGSIVVLVGGILLLLAAVLALQFTGPGFSSDLGTVLAQEQTPPPPPYGSPSPPTVGGTPFVLGEEFTRGTAGDAATQGTAATGIPGAVPWALIGATLVLFGSVFVVIARRRAASRS